MSEVCDVSWMIYTLLCSIQGVQKQTKKEPVEYFELNTWQKKNKNIGILESFQNATPI